MYQMQRGCLIATLLVGVVVVVLFSLTPNCFAPFTPFNAWQAQYFGCNVCPVAAPNADPDGDGQNNLAEFTAGTDPTDPNSVIKILSVAPTSGGLSAAKNVSSKGLESIQSSIG